jgi:aspartate aminotransferase-like enzyme
MEKELLEYSVIYTDRSCNLMSDKFKNTMKYISSTLKNVYKAESIALIPGSGTYAMESVARQFAMDKKVMVIRNGYFSYRWSDIFNVCDITSNEIVLKATQVDNTLTPQFKPPDIDYVIDQIEKNKPDIIFAPHVETATGIILDDEYLLKLSKKIHEINGIFVLDCIASGNIWCDMKKLNIDILITAPQKGWTGPASVGIVLLNKKTRNLLNNTFKAPVNSFCCNLDKWIDVMETYEKGNFKYYTTLPTDALITWSYNIKEAEEYGFDKLKNNCIELGKKIRTLFYNKKYKSISIDKYSSPTVIVLYSSNIDMVNEFKKHNIQIAGGVPLMLNEKINTKLNTFRVGLFGLDKLKNINQTVKNLENVLNKL